MALPRLDSNPRVGDQVFEAIHSAIMSGDFPGGYRLQPGELAVDLGTSIMPVREAIKRLKALQLVEEVPYRGAVVKMLSYEELLHIYTVRKLLEVEATALGAAHVTAEDIARVRSGCAAMSEALDSNEVSEYIDRDEEALEQIYQASGNPVLIDTIRVLWSRCRPFKIAGVRAQLEAGDTGPLLVHQLSLIDALERGDAPAAAEITAESLDAAIERIRNAISEEAN
ncbi:MAG: GntR family transcriptional regulator [Leucobacter sp.]